MTRMDKVALLCFTKFSLIGNLKLMHCLRIAYAWGSEFPKELWCFVRVELGGSNGRAYAQNE